MTCTRRVVLQTIGVGTVGCAMAACSGDLTEGNVPAGAAVMCGDNLCLSLAENPDLAVEGRILLFSQVRGHKIFVVRLPGGELRAMSALCTHQGCTVEWDEAGRKFDCPCHGSQFTEAGAVTAGPAVRPLPKYETLLDGDQLTILL
jgi:cytochrome b6-f complex iron-sulfur subunit